VRARKEEPGLPFCSSEQLAHIVAQLPGKHVVVTGLGLFGGGEGAARFLAERGARVTVTDLRGPEQLQPALERLSDLPLSYELGRHNVEEMLRADLVVVNPAVPRTSELFAACAEHGVPLASAMNLFLALCRAPVVGVTGATGKSTTTALLAGMLREGGHRVRLGGNIGISLLPVVDEIEPDELVVLELSSFHLEDAAYLPWSPHVAVVTNLTPNHLDRYEDFGAYSEAKRGIVAFQTRRDAAVLNAADRNLARWIERGIPSHLLVFDPLTQSGPLRTGTNLRDGRLTWSDRARQEVICGVEDIPLPGAHNIANAMAAAAAARWMGVPAEAIRAAIAGFRTLEHRLEPCGRWHGMTFYNDSDSTTPESTIAALRSFDGPLTLIAGGLNKKLDLAPLAEVAAQRAHVVVTLGASGPCIARSVLEAARRSGATPVIREVASLEQAVQAAVELSAPGSTVLFSPACASFDMFPNFAERGRRFKELVAQLADQAGADRQPA